MSSLPAAACESDGVLESFLRDMEALDRQQQAASRCEASVSTPEPKKRALETVSAAHKPTTSSSKKKRATPSWIRTRDALQTLRQQVQAMETRVVYLEAIHGVSTGQMMSVKLQKLKTKALVEKQRSRDAQEENERLKAKLQLCKMKSEAFHAAVKAVEYQQKQVVDTSVAFIRAFRARMAGEQLLPCGAQVFDMMERRIDARFYEIKCSFNVMQEPMTEVDTKVVERWCRKDDRDVGAVEFSRLELLPFKEDAASYAIWSFVEMGRLPDGERSVVIRRTEDGFALTSRVTVQIERGGVITIDSHSVIKRFTMPHAFAFMTESCSDWTATFPDSSSWRHTTREGGCFVMRDYCLNGTPGMCQARSVLHLHPGQLVVNAKQCSKSTVDQVVIPSFRRLVDARHQFVENAMFDTILGRKH